LGFGRVMIFASFHGAGKWPSWRQCLNKCVKCTRGLPERCLGPKPQAFHNFNDCISSEMSQSREFIDGSYSRASTKPPRVVCGHTRTSEALCPLRLCWLYRLGKICGLRDHELQILPLGHPFLWGISQ
jgi:hypothetical protein